MTRRIALLALTAVALAGSAAYPCAAPKRIVYAWFPHDMDDRRNNDWSTAALDWGAITHLSFRAVLLKADGSVEPGFGTTPERVRKLVQEAHRHGVKVTVLTWGVSAHDSSSYLAQNAAKTVDNLLSYVKTYDLDGVNIDDETWKKDNSVTSGSKPGPVTTKIKS